MCRFRAISLGAVLAGMLMAPLVSAQTPAAGPDLAAVKVYLQQQTALVHEGAHELQALGETYYQAAEMAGFDYQVLWDQQAQFLVPGLEEARTIWTEKASGNYEKAEGLVAGVPSLADFDLWLDAGASEVEDPVEYYPWELTLPDGTVLTNPGNIFHGISEPALWGTDPEFVGLEVDFDGDGTIELGEALPDANLLLGSFNAMVEASGLLVEAVDAWEPTLSDTFTALVVMIPTAQDYFEQWKLSQFILGEESVETEFVANSRLLDVVSIYSGLQFTWNNISAVVAEADPALADQITTELDGLVELVSRLYAEEMAGRPFTPEDADRYGAEVQARADLLAGQVTQAASLIDVPLQDIG